jgi:hypothetical protein
MVKISKELKEAIKETIEEQELLASGMASFGCAECRITHMHIDIKNDTVTYICKDYEDGKCRDWEDSEDLEGEFVLSILLNHINLKSFCPDKQCGYYKENPEKYDSIKEPCANCIVFDGGKK